MAELQRRAGPALLALRVCIALNLLLLVSCFVGIAVFFTADPESGAAELVELPGWIGGVAMLAIPVTAVFFLRWLYTARTNLDRVATHRLRNSPGWLMVSWFVPLGNAWFPYESTYEVWRLSGVYAGLPAAEAGRGIGWWWVTWLAYWGALSFAMKPGAFWSVFLASAFGAAAAWLAARMVRRLTDRQAKMFEVQAPPTRAERRG